MAKAGEFFVDLGVKGSDKTVSDVAHVKDGFSDLKSTSIETKAAMLAALAVLEQVVSTSGQLGTTLKNFEAVSGIAPQTLQRYEFAAQKAGVANESLLQSFLKLQTTAFDVRAGKGLPPWMSAIITSLAQSGQDVGSDWASRWQKDPTIGFQAMQQFAQLKNIDQSTRAQVLEQAGFAPDLVAALMRQALTPGKLSEAPSQVILNEHQVNQLDKMRQSADAGWSIMKGVFNKFLVGGLDVSDLASGGLMQEKVQHKMGNHISLENHQVIHIHGHGDPAKVKKAAHDGAMDAGKHISNTLSTQTSH